MRIKKVTVAEVPLVVTSNPDLTGVSVRDLINGDTVGARRGMLSIAEFAPGGSHKLHRHGASAQISYLLSGKGEHLTENGPISIRAGDATYVPKNTWHGFRNTGTDKAALLSIYSPASRLADVGYETFQGAIDAAKPAHVEMSGSIVGSEEFRLGVSTFEPGGLHEHLRYPRGEAFVYILEGGGEHLTPHGAVPLSTGEIAYFPGNECYGFKNAEGVLTRTLFGYFGRGTDHE